jgi:hypothetical protein
MTHKLAAQTHKHTNRRTDNRQAAGKKKPLSA